MARPKKTDVDVVVEYFSTAPIETAEVMLGVVKSILSKRNPSLAPLLRRSVRLVREKEAAQAACAAPEVYDPLVRDGS
jgi:hypothetical protein